MIEKILDKIIPRARETKIPADSLESQRVFLLFIKIFHISNYLNVTLVTHCKQPGWRWINDQPRTRVVN